MSHHNSGAHHFHHLAEAISHEHGHKEHHTGGLWLALCGQLMVLGVLVFCALGALGATVYFFTAAASCLVQTCH